MNWWVLAKQFPKYALVFGIIIGSTALFLGWWIFRPHAKAHQPLDTMAEQAATAKQAAKTETRIDYLFLADDDLYDAGTGECLFKSWLHGDHPNRLFYDAKAKKIIGQYDQGFARYAFDGTREAAMMLPQTPPALMPGFKRIVYAKGKDIWTADIDWEAFEFVNERQVTTMGIFYDQHFAENVQLLTDKTLVVRNLNNLLHVNLETGSVKPIRLPLGEIGKRRSPDSKWVVGVQNNAFYCYDVDANEGKAIQAGRTSFSDFQWLGNDKCLALSDKTVVAYERIANRLTEAATLPFPCFKMGEPSPDDHYIFCAGGLNARNGVLVDLEKRTAVQVNGGAGITWVSNDAFVYSSVVQDSDLRGTWLQTAGQAGKRLMLEPCLLNTTRPTLIVFPSTELMILAARPGLIRAERDGTDSTELNRLAVSVGLMGIERTVFQ